MARLGCIRKISIISRIFIVASMALKKKKQIEFNHTQEGIDCGQHPDISCIKHEVQEYPRNYFSLSEHRM
jgi:hypothetical protein